MRDFIRRILKEKCGDDWEHFFQSSPLIQYLDFKTGAIDGNSKTRRSLANIYAIYSLSHYYYRDFYNNPEAYKKFQGYEYSMIFNYCRSLYGGEKLQNHALNSRVNGEFLNKFPGTVEPIVINNGKYALHINYLYVMSTDISPIINAIVEEYINLLIAKDSALVYDLEELSKIADLDAKKNKIKSMLNSKVEARVFEIVAYAVLKNYYRDQFVYFGTSEEDISRVPLTLYKTGRTNANDGGIDYVMRPLGRFFQVSEVGNYNKYFLDMDKVLHFPITFVIKTERSKFDVMSDFELYIEEKSGGMEILKEKYHNAIEEIITINELRVWIDGMDSKAIVDLIQDIEDYYKYEMNFGSSVLLIDDLS